jgi:hypothetical protein
LILLILPNDLVDHEIAAVLAATTPSAFSPVKGPDSPLLVVPAVEAASSILFDSSIKAAPPIKSSPAVFYRAPFGNVAGVREVSSIDARSAPAIVPGVEFHCVIRHD